MSELELSCVYIIFLFVCFLKFKTNLYQNALRKLHFVGAWL